MTAPRCPICNKPVASTNVPTFPFCSNKCRQIDLRRWLNEVYSVPIERDDEEESLKEEE